MTPTGSALNSETMAITRNRYPLQRRGEVNGAQNASSAFFNLAGKFFSSLPPELNAAAQYCYDHKSELIAASTNLALSIELSLKATAMAHGAKVLRTHNLIDLFDVLPPHVKKSVELVYDEVVKQIPEKSSAAIEICVSKKPVPPTEKEVDAASRKYPKGHDIRSVLKAEKDAFVSWRYFYEAGAVDEISVYKIEHMRLCAVKNALAAHFIESSKTSKPSGAA